MIEFPAGTSPDVIATVMTLEVRHAYEALQAEAERQRRYLGATLEQKIEFVHGVRKYTYVNGRITDSISLEE